MGSSILGTTFACCLSMLLFSGCDKDDCQNRYSFYRPVYKTLSAVRSAMKWEGPQPIEAPGKIYLYGKYIFLNEVGKGIHVFDNTKPSSPKQLGFIRIGGNADLAIRDNTLYADSYADLAVIDINRLQAAKPVAFMDKVFADKSYYWGNTTNPDSVLVITEFQKVDTLIDCETVNNWNNCITCSFEDATGNVAFASQSAASKAMNGTGGSMARFTLANHFLYTVTYNELSTFDVSIPQAPALVHTQQPGWNIETIYPFNNKLFIGSSTGMFIYDLSNPAAPTAQGRFDHARVCDPVIADGNYAYVTLRSGSGFCAGFTNQLDVVNIASIMQPSLLKSYQLTNPHGLSKDGNLLFICDGKSGVKVFDAGNPAGLKLIGTKSGIGETYDVIAANGVALVVSSQGIYQFDYSHSGSLRLLSKIAVNKL